MELNSKQNVTKLKPKLLNIPFASCSFINLDFLVPHIAHFNSNSVLPLLTFETFGFILSVFFFYTLKNIVLYLKFKIILKII